jgi:hypothetical protein
LLRDDLLLQVLTGKLTPKRSNCAKRVPTSHCGGPGERLRRRRDCLDHLRLNTWAASCAHASAGSLTVCFVMRPVLQLTHDEEGKILEVIDR